MDVLRIPDSNLGVGVEEGVDALEEVLRVSTFPMEKAWFALTRPFQGRQGLLAGCLEYPGPF